jgi:hypothetical protein
MNYGYADRWDVAAAFCRPGDTEFGLVASLVLQLVESRVQEMQTAFPLSDLVQNSNIDCRLMWMLLDAAITECSGRDTIILIDGLDELENQDTASFLKNLVYFGERIAHTTNSTAKVRVLIASRSYADLNEKFGDLPNIEPGKERRGAPFNYSSSQSLTDIKFQSASRAFSSKSGMRGNAAWKAFSTPVDGFLRTLNSLPGNKGKRPMFCGLRENQGVANQPW